MSSRFPAKAMLLRPRSFPVLGGIAVAALAFAVTKYALGLFAVTPPLPAEPTADLPKFILSNFRWIAMQGLDAKVIGGTPAVKDAPILRIVALPKPGRHMLAGEVSGLAKNHVYRIALWVKPQAGANFEIEVGDHADAGASYGIGMFDLASHKAGGMTTAKPGTAPAPDGWQKVWVDLPTSNGQLFFALYVLEGGENRFTGDGKTGITLGGIAMEPQG